MAVQARSLVPYLADAVPGWFQAKVTVYDTQGKEMACADHYRFDPDPVISCVIPADGRYVVEISDALYRGREDFVYRISIGQLPFVTSIFPLGGPAGAVTPVLLTGWNLPRTGIVMNAKDRRLGIFPLWDGGETFINSRLVDVDDLPECLEKESNDTPEEGQPVDLPVVINGRIEKPGASDWFRFHGSAGQKIVAEVLARRLGSPLDSALRITDAAGKQIAFNDDHTDKAFGLLTHQADSWLMATLPADGTYYVQLYDVQRHAGPEYAYRLRLSAPRPDFDLRVTPSAIDIRRGETMPLAVHAIRRDGFDGDIRLFLPAPADGLTLSGGLIPAGQDSIRVTVTAPRDRVDDSPNLQIDGRATIAGRQVVHQAAPADDQMQAFAYRQLVPVDEFRICVANRMFPRGSGRILSPLSLKIPAGGSASLEVVLPGGPFLGDVQTELNDPPPGITLEKIEMRHRRSHPASLRCGHGQARHQRQSDL